MKALLIKCATLLIICGMAFVYGTLKYWEDAGYIDINFSINYTNYDEDQTGTITNAGGI